jgi:hypothetical protein
MRGNRPIPRAANAAAAAANSVDLAAREALLLLRQLRGEGIAASLEIGGKTIPVKLRIKPGGKP